MEIEVSSMKQRFSGAVATVLSLLMAGGLVLMDHFNVIHLTRIGSLWPVVLIAIGLEELFAWAHSNNRR